MNLGRIVKILSIAVVLLSDWENLAAQNNAANPFSDGARLNYSIIRNFATRAAAKMPDDKYGFRATPGPDVRTFGQYIGHLADSNYRICSILQGIDPPLDNAIERNKSSKSDLVKALADSFAYCDPVYRSMTDAVGAEMIKFDTGGEGTRVPLRMPKLTVLAFHVQHAFEHYGNLVTYMRMNAIVPPSSELQPLHELSERPTNDQRPHSDVSGVWKLLVQTPNGAVAAYLDIRVDGSSVVIEADSERGPVSFRGSISATEIKFSGLLQTLPLSFTGTPGTESMSGTVDFGGHSQGTWTASRQK